MLINRDLLLQNLSMMENLMDEIVGVILFGMSSFIIPCPF